MDLLDEEGMFIEETSSSSFENLNSFEDSKSQRRLFLASLFTQGGAVFASKALIAPFDRLKLLIQTETPIPTARPLSQWWRGFPMHLGQLAIGNGVRMYVCACLPESQDLSLGKNLLAASLAIAAAYPLDVLYTMKATDRINAGHLFRGFRYAVISTPLFVLTALGTIKAVDEYLGEAERKEFPRNIATGGFAGFVASAVTYPLDTLRRREIIGNISRRRLFAGLSVHLMKSFPEYAILAFVYNQLVSLNNV